MHEINTDGEGAQLNCLSTSYVFFRNEIIPWSYKTTGNKTKLQNYFDNKATGLGILSLTETRHIQGRASYMTHFSFSKFLLYKAAPTGNPAKYSRDLVKMKSDI